MKQDKLEMLDYLQSGHWDYMLTATFRGEVNYQPNLLDYKIAELNCLMSHINSKQVNRRWYKFHKKEYITAFGIMEWGRNKVNPHYHILLNVPNIQVQTYEALNKSFNDPNLTSRFENIHIVKRSDSKKLASYLLKENHWQNGVLYAFCANTSKTLTSPK